MKKTLSVLAVLGIAAVIGTHSANAFEWSSLNPAYWGHCPKCEKQKAAPVLKKLTLVRRLNAILAKKKRNVILARKQLIHAHVLQAQQHLVILALRRLYLATLVQNLHAACLRNNHANHARNFKKWLSNNTFSFFTKSAAIILIDSRFFYKSSIYLITKFSKYLKLYVLIGERYG